MFALIRLVAGRRILVLVLLAALAAASTPALREKATRFIACGASLQAGALFGSSGASVVRAVSGGQMRRDSTHQCRREAMRTTGAARTWMQRRSRAQ
jgi:hypothetical protein